MGVGECAGEVVSSLEFDLTAAERETFEAQLALEGGDAAKAAGRAVHAMLTAARGLVATQLPDVAERPEAVVKEFRERFYDTQLFWDPFAGGRFGAFLFKAVESPEGAATADSARRLVEESQLFVEAAHSCRLRLAQQGMKV
jgi:sulfite reductase (ferredoxin)